MAILNRCMFSATSAGTGDFVELAAILGYQTMEAAGAVNGTVYGYAAQSSDLTQWEYGEGTYSGPTTPTLQRATIVGNSLGTTAKINFSNPPQVMLSPLASDITLPDPLFLTRGLSLIAVDPNVSGNPNDAQGVQIQVTYDKLVTDPGFTDTNGLELTLNYLHGNNTYGTDNGVTASKTTPIALNVFHNAVGAGEHFCAAFDLSAYGFSDAFCFGGGGVTYAVGPIAGDEGVGLTPEEFGVFQLNNIVTATVTSVTRTTFSTTTTQIITGSQNPQTITVASTSGANVNDWIVFNQELPIAGGTSNLCVAQITAIGSGTITCICPNNFTSGVTITPALILGVNSTYEMGEQRVIVNLSGASYSTGQIHTGWPLVGVGTTWTDAMVGGSATNIGAVSIDQDIYSDTTQTHFGGNPLHSWYQLLDVGATALHTYGNTAYGIMAYAGNALAGASLFSTTCTISLGSPGLITLGTGSAPPAGTAVRFTTTGALPTGITANKPYWVINPSGATFNVAANSDGTNPINTSGSQSGVQTVFNGGYTIVPCARTLWISPPGGSGQLICETSTATWNIGDNIECVICPYSYVQGLNLQFKHFNPGASLITGLALQNSGARQYQTGLSVGEASGGSIGNLNSDPTAWSAGVSVSSCDIGVLIDAQTTGIDFTSTTQCMRFGNGTTIVAGSTGLIIGPIDISGVTGSNPAGITIWSTGFNPSPPAPAACLDLYLNASTHMGLLIRAGGGVTNVDLAQFSGLHVTAGYDKYATPYSYVLNLKPDSFSNTGSYYASPSEGMLRAFNDANNGTIGGTITAGGGSNHVLGYYNGTNWIVVS